MRLAPTPSIPKSQLNNYIAVNIAEILIKDPQQSDIDKIEKILSDYRELIIKK